MRNIIPIIFAAATLLAGCKSPAQTGKKTNGGATTAGAKTTVNVTTNSAATTIAAANADAIAATTAPAPVTVGPNTPAQTLSENTRLGNFGAAFIVILAVAAARRP